MKYFYIEGYTGTVVELYVFRGTMLLEVLQY